MKHLSNVLSNLSELGFVRHKYRTSLISLLYIKRYFQYKKPKFKNTGRLFQHLLESHVPFIQTYFWFCVDGRVLPINHRQTVHPNGTLTVENVQQKSDQGTYTCQARNRQGLSDKGSVDISVMGKLHETDIPFSFNLTCIRFVNLFTMSVWS
jgi:hypothetical protein